MPYGRPPAKGRIAGKKEKVTGGNNPMKMPPGPLGILRRAP